MTDDQAQQLRFRLRWISLVAGALFTAFVSSFIITADALLEMGFVRSVLRIL